MCLRRRLCFVFVLSAIAVSLVSPAPAGQKKTEAALRWVELQPGLSFDRIFDPTFCRKGSRYTGAIRIDPSLYRFEAFHYSRNEDRAMMNAGEWRDRLKAVLVFNAGQYYEDSRHMGLLVKGGENLGTPLIRQWKALFVEHNALPKDSGLVEILDLKYDQADSTGSNYSFALQSYMLVDHEGRKRVKNTDLVANRAALGEMKDGSITVFCSEGGYTLHDFADFLATLGPDVYRIMGLDGGYQAQFALQTPAFRYETYGGWTPGAPVTSMALPVRLRIPAVVAVFPRARNAEQ